MDEPSHIPPDATGRGHCSDTPETPAWLDAPWQAISDNSTSNRADDAADDPTEDSGASADTVLTDCDTSRDVPCPQCDHMISWYSISRPRLQIWAVLILTLVVPLNGLVVFGIWAVANANLPWMRHWNPRTVAYGIVAILFLASAIPIGCALALPRVIRVPCSRCGWSEKRYRRGLRLPKPAEMLKTLGAILGCLPH